MHDNVKFLPGGRPGENRPAIESGYDIDVFIVYGSNNKHLVDNHWVHDVAPVHIPALRCRDMMIDDNGDYNVFNQVHKPLTDLAGFQKCITTHNEYLNNLSKANDFNLCTILAWTWHGNVLLHHVMKLKQNMKYDPIFENMHVKTGSAAKCTLDENGFPREADFYLHTDYTGSITYAVCESQLRTKMHDYTSTPQALIQKICNMDGTSRLKVWTEALTAWREEIYAIILKAPRLNQDIYLYHGTHMSYQHNYVKHFGHHVQAFSLCPSCALLYARQKHKNEEHLIFRLKVPAGSPLLMFPGLDLAVKYYTYCEVLIPRDMAVEEQARHDIVYHRGLNHNGKDKGFSKCHVIDITLTNPNKM